MKESAIKQDVWGREKVTSFGGAELWMDSKGRSEIIGGTAEERNQAAEWATKFLNNRCGLRWYSKAHTRRIKLPRLR